jgi:GMP synthase-like glutamine amidotransferase
LPINAAGGRTPQDRLFLVCFGALLIAIAFGRETARHRGHARALCRFGFRKAERDAACAALDEGV